MLPSKMKRQRAANDTFKKTLGNAEKQQTAVKLCAFKSISMMQCLLLCPASRAQTEWLAAEPGAAQPCQHQHCQAAEEKSSALKCRKTSALYQFDVIVGLTSLCSPSSQWLSFVFHVLREQMTYFSYIIIPGFSSLPPWEWRRSAGSVFVEDIQLGLGWWVIWREKG